MSKLRGLERKEFSQAVRKLAFKRCCDKDGKPRCENCEIVLRAGNIIFEHVRPAGLQGDAALSNCLVHCKNCADRKTFTEDLPRMAKADRVLKVTFGLKRKSRPFPGSKASGIRKRMNGQVERRT